MIILSEVKNNLFPDARGPNVHDEKTSRAKKTNMFAEPSRADTALSWLIGAFSVAFNYPSHLMDLNVAWGVAASDTVFDGCVMDVS